MRFGKKRLIRFRTSRAVIIPMEILRHWEQEVGRKIDEVELTFVDGELRIAPPEE